MATASSNPNPSVGSASLHTAWLFQAIASFPTAFVLGINVFDSLFSPYYLQIYPFITYTFNTLFASAIIFLVLVQWSLTKRRTSNPQLTFVIESAKALTATVMWLWLLLDSIFYNPRYYYGNRGKRITVAAVSVILVVVLFYPTAMYAAYARKQVVLESQETAGQGEESAAAGSESTPLLAEGRGGASSEERLA